MLDDLVKSLLPPLLSGFVSAFITVRLALNRFYREKHWEKKSEAYSSIMDALYTIKKCSKIFSENDLRDLRISEEESNLLSQKYTNAYDEFERRVDISIHILSDEAQDLIREARKKFADKKHDPLDSPMWDVYHGFFATASETLEKISFVASRDLQFVRGNQTSRLLRLYKRLRGS